VQPPAREYKPVELNLCHFMPPMHPLNTKILVPFAEELAEKTDGRVKIFVYPANELVGAADNFDGTVSGVIDIGFTLPAYTPGRFPLTTILEFPFMFTSPVQSNLVAWELLNTNPAITETEYKDVKVLWYGTTDLGHFLLKKPVDTVEGLKGLRLRSPSTVGNDVIASLGAVPVTMPVPEVYDAIERSIVEGTLLPVSTLISFNLSEVVDYVLEMNMYATPLHMVMNKASWDKISPEDQEIMTELLAKFPEIMGKQYLGDTEAGFKRAADAGIPVVSPSPAEMQKFHEAVDPLIAGWISDMEAKGLPGQEVFDQVKALAEKYK
jgi:TRAP-type transport system periplasmic protein